MARKYAALRIEVTGLVGGEHVNLSFYQEVEAFDVFDAVAKCARQEACDLARAKGIEARKNGFPRFDWVEAGKGVGSVHPVEPA